MLGGLRVHEREQEVGSLFGRMEPTVVLNEPVDRVADRVGPAWALHLRDDGVECF